MYPHYIYWKIDLTNVKDPFDIIGPRTGKKIRKALSILDGSPFQFKIEQIDNALLDAFVPLYEDNMRSKQNGTIFPVKEKILECTAKGKTYEMVSLYENNVFVGGMIYSVQKERISVAYKVFPKDTPLKFPVSLSFVAEYKLFERAMELKKTELLHGKDRNCYGVFSNVGLAMYKLQIGCLPHVSQSKENTFYEEHDIKPTSDTLVFLGSKNGEPIHEAILYTTKDEETAKMVYQILFSRSFLTVTIKTI